MTLATTKSERISRIVSDINEWMQFVRDDTGIADIDDALGEFHDAMRASDVTEDEVYRAFRAQFN